METQVRKTVQISDLPTQGNTNDASDLMEFQAKNIREFSEKVWPYQKEMLESMSELGRIQREAFPHVASA